MDESTRRQITWILVIGAIFCVILVASYRKNELKRLADAIGTGTPQQRIAAVKVLVHKQKLMEALEDQPRWVQDNAIAAVALIGSNDAYYELLGCHNIFDAPAQSRDQTIFNRLGRRGVEIFIEALQDKDATTAATAKPPLIAIGKELEAADPKGKNPVLDGSMELLDAWDQPVRDAVRDIIAGIASPRAADLMINVMRQTEPKQKILKDGKTRKQTTQEFMRARSTAQAALVAMAVPAIKPIIDGLLSYEVAEVRGLACKMLGDIGSPLVASKPADVATMIPPLLTRLDSATEPEWAVRRRAATALGLLGDVAKQNGVARPLIAHLNDQEEVKAACAEALGRLADPIAIEPLVNTLLTNRAGATRELRIALVAMGEPAIPQIVRALSSPETEVRLIATRCLAEIGGYDALSPLARMLKDSAVEIRRVAANALRDTAREHVLQQVAEALGDPDWQVYHAARDALANVRGPAVPFLVAALASNNPRVNSMAQQALVRIGEPALASLQAALFSASETQARWSAIALGSIGPPAVKYATAVLRDTAKPTRARAMAALALGRTRAGDAVEPLIAALQQQEPVVKVAAIGALNALADDRATPALVSALQDPSPQVRDAAMDVLSDWRMPDTLEALGKVAISSDQNAARRATIVIAELTAVAAHELLEQVTAVDAESPGQQRVNVKTLEGAATDGRESEKVRRRAIHALGYVGDESTLNTLTVLLKPGNPYASEAAIAAARIGGRLAPRTEEGLRPELSPAGRTLIDLLLSTSDVDLQLKVANALAIMGEQPVWELLARLEKAPVSQKPLIVATLGAIGKAATDAVLEVRGETKDVPYKQWLAAALKLIGDAQALELLSHLPETEQPQPDQVAASQALLDRIRTL